MKIAIVSPYTNPCPPPTYGGEIFYWHIANEMGKRGHEVTLIAPGGSEVPHNGKLLYSPATSNGMISYHIEDWIVDTYHKEMLEADILHDCSLDHIVAERMKYLYGKKAIINTINGSTYYMPRPPFNVVTGSKFWQTEAKTYGLNTEMVYWGVDTDFYTPLDGEREDYLLWMARFHPDKGLDVALDLAEYLGFNLKVAGSMSFSDHKKYGMEYIKRIDGMKNVEYVDIPLDSTYHARKRDLMRKARAFLYPVKYNECFGMVVAEAMSCGTPVITSRNGAMPELVDNEMSGFLCADKSELANAITHRLPFYENHKQYHNGYDIWHSARNKALMFDVRRSVDGYEKLYEKVVQGEEWR